MLVEQKKGYGFRGDMFPLMACVIGMSAITLSYVIARGADHCKRFPQSDITSCGTQFPQYIVFRIGLLSVIPLLAFSWQLAKNYLQILSFRLRQQAQPRLDNIGWIGAIASFGLALSTATISDSKDMNYTLHSIGAISFFVITLYNCITVSAVYRQLWQYKHFCNIGSYLYKTTIKPIAYVLLGVQILCWLKIVDIGSLIEWLATFYILGYFFSLGLDIRHMDMMFIRR